MPPFSLIVAVDSRLGIGKNGGLPWQLKADLKHFREITTSTQNSAKKNAVIMGRRTWDSLPDNFRPLPQRMNIVITRNANLVVPGGVMVQPSLELALATLEEGVSSDVESVFVIGGGEIFRQALVLPQCREIFLTRLEGDFQCDAFFPEFNHLFILAETGPILEEKGLRFFFSRHLRKQI